MSDGGQQAAGGPVDLSPGVTTVAFDPIVPPLRIPVPAGDDDDPSKGEWLLSFKDEDSWRRGWEKCHSKISEQCEPVGSCCPSRITRWSAHEMVLIRGNVKMGARMGCSISAANICRIPWWKQALAFMKAAKLEAGEREACEEREMMTCLAGSKDTCTKYARDTCDPVFAEARIAETHVPLDPRFKGPLRRKRLPRDFKKQNEHLFDEKNPDAVVADRYYQLGSKEPFESAEADSKKPTNYRGRKLMTKESDQRTWDGPAWSESPVEGETSGATEAPIDGWEGGLIRPKFDHPTVESRDQNHSDARKETIWQGVEQRLRGLFKNGRI